MNLTENQIKRYSRNILIQEIGIQGMEKLLQSRVLVIGAGGLGSSSIFYLAANGIGTLGIADYDKVDLTNLQRQILHFTQDINKEKTDSAKDKINRLNPEVQIVTYNQKINKDNITKIINDYDFIIDATDNFESKFLINDACVTLNKPYSHCGVSRFEGQTLTYIPGHTCYRCLFDQPPPVDKVLLTSKVGILGTIPGIFGAIQATESIKYLTGIGELLVDTLLIMNFKDMSIRKIKVTKNKNCQICNKK
ncbi:MAG TPA: HesA/MoeB/ThiF family protein [Spirochaetota bacterium]|nr:HesA/MoeB/ThiF family protein [Spirochaetota bacterium]HPP05319.1 HesA/MoeB/ThiF family protein [Spirochaetota bacterium]